MKNKFKCDHTKLYLLFKDFYDLSAKKLPRYGEFCLLELKDGRITAGEWNPDEDDYREKASGKFIRGTGDTVPADEVSRWHHLDCYDLSGCLEEEDTECIRFPSEEGEKRSVEIRGFKSWRDDDFPKSEQYCLLILTNGDISAGRWDRWSIDNNDGTFEHAPAAFDISKEKVWAWAPLGDDDIFLREEESEKERLHEEELNRNPSIDPEMFKYGTDISVYYEKALEKLREKYPWATMTRMKKKTAWEIAASKGKCVFGQVEKIYDGRKVVHEWKDGKNSDEFIDFLYRYTEDSVKNNDPEKKFRLGMDIKVYLDKAYENVKKEYHWLSKELIRKNQDYYYSIMQPEEDWEFVKTYKTGGDYICECGTSEAFIESVENDYRQLALSANKVVDMYEVPFGHVVIHGWNLERYDIYKMETGDYKVNVTAGDRVAGGSREFFITPHCFKAKSYEEFLDRYLEIVPGESFGLTKKDLLSDKKLKKFLGY